MRRISLLVAFALMMSGTSFGNERFERLVGPVNVGPVTEVSPLVVPFITWGGDMATFYANAGVTTRPNSIFQRQGLNLKLVPGDDFVQQVRDYMAGKTPFLRGTFRMIGMASEVLGSDPRTKPYIIMQLTWSAGDHCVARGNIKSLTDLKGKKIVLQKGGPHVGMLDDLLDTAKLKWSDVTIVWADDLTGTDKSPAEIFRKMPDVAACFVISPDMIGLTGGLEDIGTGAEGTVRDAHVLVSTAELSYSIADVYAVRKDFYDSNPELVAKFVAGYLKACEEVVDLKNAYERAGSAEYVKLLQLTQDIYGKDVIPTLEEDAHGLLSDCTFVGYPGNVSFFTRQNNPRGFEVFQTKSLDLAVSQGYAGIRQGFFKSPLDWNSPVFTNYLTKLTVERGERFRAEALIDEIEALSAGGVLDDRTILSFSINFEPNQDSFSEVQYGTEYNRVTDALGRFGNAVIAIRGHSDPTKALLDCVHAGMAKGIIKRTGTAPNYRYSIGGRPLDLEATDEIMRLIEAGEFDGVPNHNPREVMQAALNLSRKRAEAVRASVIEYAQKKGIEIDQSQIQPVGVGIREPFIAKPSNMDEARQNMRVEFRIIRVTAEVMTTSDFDF